MSPLLYQRVKEIFLAVCDRPEAERVDAAANMCADDPELKAEVLSLLESHQRAVRVAEDSLAGLERQAAGPDPRRTEPVTEAASAEAPRRMPPRESDGSWRGGDARPLAASGSPRASHGSGSSFALGTGGRHALKGRFSTGTILVDRYRVVSLLGSGGMGEVYRADDLTLDQPVALKFLPATHGNDPLWLERFYNEVRLSRQVTHANVCRVFDIGQVGDEHFITMELIDGEDLASLLRRIGRLPKDKALQIARQLCAGLAAAHERGVLHRDLKPANVMLDGRGQVRITDFGISALMEAGDDAEGPLTSPAAGTPAYMAPEQFSKGQASVRSDIYSLGLVMYEIFSGQPVFSADSMPEYARLHRQATPTHPSTLLPDIDPLAERVILQCLEKDPERRPRGALAVSAALPGGDPLAAALAAGETPSPEMIAAAGGTGAMSIANAALVLAATLAGLLVCVLLSRQAFLMPRLLLNKEPAVLGDKAQQVLASVGYSRPLKSSAQGFSLDDQLVALVQKENKTRSRWDQLAAARSGAVMFWYRQSPDYMISKDDITLGMVTLDEPARIEPGMRTVILDGQGRLRRLEVLPGAGPGWEGRDSQDTASAITAADFTSLFQLADLRFEDFNLIPASQAPPMYADQRFAWQGHYPESPDQTVQVQAASFRGKPVYFQIIDPWRGSSNLAGINPTSDLRAGNVALQMTLILVAMGSGVVLAWRNARAGRGDSAGAQKLSGAFLILGVLIWLLCASHVPDVHELGSEIRMFLRVLGFIMVPAMGSWMYYQALEPHVRRLWPETIISWSRVLAGNWRDPLVAKHVLIGLAIGLGAMILAQFGNLAPMWVGHAAAVNNMSALMKFLAKENPSTVAIWTLLQALYMGLLYLLTLILFQLVLRRRWLAEGAFVLLVVFNTVQFSEAGWIQWIQAAILTGLTLLMLVRYGLVTTMSGLWTIYFLRSVPVTSDMSMWYASQTRFAMGLLSVVAVAAAFLATAGWRNPAGTTARASSA